MPKYEVTAATIIEATDADEAFAIGSRLLVGHGWRNGEIADVALMEDDEELIESEPVTDEQREEWKRWEDDATGGVNRAM